VSSSARTAGSALTLTARYPCEPFGERDTEAAHERREVATPGDSDRDISNRVLEDQIPADHPGDELTERGVGVGIGAAGLRNHRGQLGVTQRGQPAHDAKQQERQDQRGTRGGADDRSVGTDLAGGGRADRREDAGADHGADREHDQIAGAEGALEGMGAFDRL